MSQDKKRDAIIEAAIKRFAHFGVAKTTMTEIGNDLSLSKASLYYYFPDKLNLYAAVLKNIIEENRTKDDELLNRQSDPKQAFITFLEIRTNFIIKYYNILEYLKTYSPPNIPPELEVLFTYLKERQLARIISVMKKGKEKGVFKIENISKTAELYFDFLEGFRFASLSSSGNFFPDKKQFQALLKREKEFTEVFSKGLTI